METIQKQLDEIRKSQKFVITPKRLAKLKDCIGNVDNISKQQIECINKLHTGYLKKHDKYALLKLFEQNTNEEVTPQATNTETKIVTATQTEQDIEKVLDKLVPKYNGFSEKHPMDYISYDDKRDRYIFRYPKCKAIPRKKLVDICDISIKK